jgi:pyridoxine 4-dehydrogenase
MGAAGRPRVGAAGAAPGGRAGSHVLRHRERGSWIITDHPDTVRRQVHEALADLGTRESELTYLRLGGDGPAPPGDVPLEDSLGVLVELRDQGLIRRIGLSGASPEMLSRAEDDADRGCAEPFQPARPQRRPGPRRLRGTGHHVRPYFPLASGRLSSYDELAGPAERLGATPAQVALAWLLRRSPAMVVIPGTTNPDHLRANIAATEIARDLTGAEVTRLTGLVDESKAVIDQPRQPTLNARAGRR